MYCKEERDSKNEIGKTMNLYTFRNNKRIVDELSNKQSIKQLFLECNQLDARRESVSKAVIHMR